MPNPSSNLHTTPEALYKMAPVIAATTAEVETDVVRIDFVDVIKNSAWAE